MDGKDKRKFYISGPISGTSDYMERFANAEGFLKLKGHEVINPAKVNSMMPEGTTWSEYMEMSLTMLDMCDAIYFLKGWERSKGAKLEFLYAAQSEKGYFFAYAGNGMI